MYYGFVLAATIKRCVFSPTPKSQGKCILPCQCTKGCDTRTGACIRGGRCIDGHPSQYKWHGPACHTGEYNSCTHTLAHTHSYTCNYRQTQWRFISKAGNKFRRRLLLPMNSSNTAYIAGRFAVFKAKYNYDLLRAHILLVCM